MTQFMINGLLRSFRPHVIDNLCETITCDYRQCVQVEKNLLYLCDNKKEDFLNQDISERFKATKLLLDQTLTRDVIFQKRSDILFYGVMSILLLITIFGVCAIYYSKTIKYNGLRIWGNYIKFRSSSRIVRFKSFNIDIELRQIKKLRIITTTPLIPMKTAIDQINWRDNVEIICEENGNIDSTEISLFNYPGLKRIVIDVLKRMPQIEIEFTKRTVFSANINGYN